MPLFTPIGGGGIGKATVTATTGSPTVDTSSRAGKTIYLFTGSGSITVGTAGTCELLVLGGGGGGGSAAGNGGGGGGGAGGLFYDTSVFLPAGTLTVTVGAGGATDSTGATSRIGNYYGIGGGAGGGLSTTQNSPTTIGGGGGGSGGGGAGFGGTGASGTGVSSQGNSGGTGWWRWRWWWCNCGRFKHYWW
jgi:hypothetical protein